MDVRCDRCQTEYELDDESVTDAGASVQCTTCGHTFVVSRAGAPASSAAMAVTPPSGVDFTSPGMPDWTLATEEGKTHRFRDLTTLQKWIVERRVTRGDRVSQRGGAWRRLGDVDELRPFFEVVEQADRTRAADPRGTRSTTRPATAAPRHHTSGAAQRLSRNPGEAEDDDIFVTSRRGRPPAVTGGGSDAFATGFGTDEDLEAVSFQPNRRRVKVAAAGIGIGMAAAIAAYLAFRVSRSDGTADAKVAVRPAVATAPAAPAPAAAPPPPAAPAAPPVAAAAPPPAAAAPPPALPVTPVPPPAAAPAPAEAPAAVAPAEPAAAPRPKTYERLVAEADRALENGNTGKAQKLYDEALKLQPDGVAATTGSAYLLLDRQKPLAAIALFKRALANAPSFPAALFGLGEAYRSQGDTAHAVEAYKRYLAAAPSGEDAPAARRQVRELGEAPAPAGGAEATKAP